MNKTIAAALALTFSASFLFAQSPDKGGVVTQKSVAAAAELSPQETAAAVITAHGGDKFRQMRSFLVRGTVDVTSGSTFVLPATFLIVISGDKYVFELNNPLQPLRQVYNGKTSHSTGYELPPVTSLGFSLLMKVGASGYTVSALGEVKKKRKGFRVTMPEGFYTDFIVDEKTGKIKGYESSYDIDGSIVTTSVEIDEFETVEGVIVPKKYSQRFDLGQITAYASFKAKEILVNTPIADDVFALPK
jgi:hypothetical protein